MNAAFLVSIVFVCLTLAESSGQEKTEKYQTRFVPEHITYNGSDKPGECVESVDSGIRIETKEGDLFFVMPVAQLNRLQEIIKDEEVLVEVVYYPVLERASNGSGARGYIKKITLKSEVMYSNP